MLQKTMPASLTLQKDFIDESTERWLLEDIKELCQKRYETGGCAAPRVAGIYPNLTTEVPNKLQVFCHEVAKQFYAEGLTSQRFSTCLVGGYDPGDGINPHVDCVETIGESLVTLNLGSGVVLEFASAEDKIEVYYPPRSLAVMRGDARYKYTHGISPRAYDYVNGEKIPRGQRFALVWRHRIDFISANLL